MIRRIESLELFLSFSFLPPVALDCMVSCLALVELQPDPCDLVLGLPPLFL